MPKKKDISDTRSGHIIFQTLGHINLVIWELIMGFNLLQIGPTANCTIVATEKWCITKFIDEVLISHS